MAAKNEFSFRESSHVENHFPKRFPNKIWHKEEENEFIYIFKLQFKKKNILFKKGGQNKFCHIVQ